VTAQKPVKEVTGISRDNIPDEVLTSVEPLLLKGLVADWPMVAAYRDSTRAAVDYLKSFYKNATVGSFVGPPGGDGRVFYNPEMTGFNYQRVMLKLDQMLDKILEHEDDPSPPMLYVGSTTIDTCLPGFREANDIEFGDVKPLASIWLGNRSRVAAHFDVPDNLACVVAGRRRFTLFPPEQLENLYVGPLEFNPGGQAISLVDLKNPDFDKFPRFRVALEHSLVADMEAGDALFLPSMWWHNVEGLESFNVLINYWWRRSPAYMHSPAEVLTHAILAIRDLPGAQREAWREIFRHYVFDADEATSAHIPEHCRGMLAPLDDMAARRIRAELLNKLNR
jgi:hypothetical protein